MPEQFAELPSLSIIAAEGIRGDVVRQEKVEREDSVVTCFA